MIGVRGGGDDLAFDVHLGVLIAVTFVVFEVLLLPLFEYTRESLTIALVRYRIAKGKPVTICPETSVPVALGLSDGLYGKSGFITIPRALKIFFKVALISSVFTWEFNLDLVERAQVVAFEFNSKGPRGPKGQASVMFPLPIEGISHNTSSNSKVTVMVNPFRPRFPRNFSESRVKRIDWQYSAHCVKIQESGTRVAYLGIFSLDKLGRRKIYCLNGTHSREKAEVLSYNPNSERSSSPVTSFSVQKLYDFPGARFLYSAQVNISSPGELTSTHDGVLKIQPSFAMRHKNVTFTREIRTKNGTRILKKVQWKRSRVVVAFTVFGLLIHSSKGTILKIHQPRKSVGVATIACNSNITRKGTMRTVRDIDPNCRRHFGGRQFFSFHFKANEGPSVQDIDLHLVQSATFKVGTPMDVIRAWMRSKATRKILHQDLNFADNVWRALNGNVFYFSEPKKKQLMLRVGDPKKRVRMKKWPTAGLLVVVLLFFAYSLACVVLKYRSRICTGISSECVTRTAMLEFIGREASLKSTLLLNDLGSSATFGLSHSGPTNQHLRLESADKIEEVPSMRFARLGESRHSCICHYPSTTVNNGYWGNQ